MNFVADISKPSCLASVSINNCNKVTTDNLDGNALGGTRRRVHLQYADEDDLQTEERQRTVSEGLRTGRRVSYERSV